MVASKEEVGDLLHHAEKSDQLGAFSSNKGRSRSRGIMKIGGKADGWRMLHAGCWILLAQFA